MCVCVCVFVLWTPQHEAELIIMLETCCFCHYSNFKTHVYAMLWKIDVTETPAAAYIPNKSDTIAFDNRMMLKKQAQCPSVITLHVTALRAVIRKKVMKISLNL